MGRRADADDGRYDGRLSAQPGQGDLRVTLAARLGDLAHDVEDGPVALGGATLPGLLSVVGCDGDAALGRAVAGAVFARQEAAA